MSNTENKLLLQEGAKIAKALGHTLAPLVEVVLHDLTNPEHAIVTIANNLSGRKIGDPATEIGLARIHDPHFPEVLQNYPNQFPDGRPAKSTSIGLKNSKGDYVAAICLNLDISLLQAITHNLGQLAQTQTELTDICESLSSTKSHTIKGSLEQFAAAYNTTPRALTANQRKEAIHQLAQQGLMDLKNAQSMAAQVLGVARSTVYSYLPKKRK